MDEETFFKTKRLILCHLDMRINRYEEKLKEMYSADDSWDHYSGLVQELEDVQSFIRNNILLDTSP